MAKYKLIIEYCEEEEKKYRWLLTSTNEEVIVNYGYEEDMLTAIAEAKEFFLQLQKSGL